MHDRADRGFNENSLHVVGHVAHDPRSFTISGELLTTFSVSANRGNAVEWFQVSTRGPLASYCQGEVRKGQMLYARGALRRRTYEDRDGNVRSVMEIVARQVEIHAEKGGSLNLWVAAGRFGETPKLSYTQQGTPYTQLLLGVDIPRQEQSAAAARTDWLRVSVWRSDAERCWRLGRTGRSALVEGYANSYQYRSPDGRTGTQWSLVATRPVLLLGSDRQDEERVPDVEAA